MRTVFFDVDTQLDFLLPAGALYVPGAERLVPTLSRLAAFAAARSIPVISTVDAHSESDPEFRVWKPHCVVDTVGQRKPVTTLLSQAMTVHSLPIDATMLARNVSFSQQILLEKQHTDCFTNPNLRPLLSLLQADEYIVYGVVTEICVQEAVLGLLALGAKVGVLVDAVRSLEQAKSDSFLQLAQQQGALLTTAAAILN